MLRLLVECQHERFNQSSQAVRKLGPVKTSMVVAAEAIFFARPGNNAAIIEVLTGPRTYVSVTRGIDFPLHAIRNAKIANRNLKIIYCDQPLM